MFTIEYVKDLKWDNKERTSFNCIVKYEEFNEEMPCGVNGNDPYAHIQELWAKGNAGDYGEIAEYVETVVYEKIPQTVIEQITNTDPNTQA